MGREWASKSISVGGEASTDDLADVPGLRCVLATDDPGLFGAFPAAEVRRCSACGRYRAADLQGADDMSMSWESVGFAILKPDMRDSLLSKPWMLVTPKVRRVFRDAGVTSFDWTPIRVEDGDGEPPSKRG